MSDPTHKSHEYKTALHWDGSKTGGTADYRTYDRQYRIRIKDKPDLVGSSDPVFLGDGALYNPEDLFVAALSSCHLLTYLAECARNRIVVLSYEDEASGTLVLDNKGGGKFSEVTLRPLVTIAEGCDEELAMKLHDESHKRCFVAASVSVPVKHEPVIRVDHNFKTVAKAAIRGTP
jgi:organic hydroperoxide reductase OsmC/OhrA